MEETTEVRSLFEGLQEEEELIYYRSVAKQKCKRRLKI